MAKRRKPEGTFKTTKSRLAAALFTLGHTERAVDPCSWTLDDGKERCAFFFPENPDAKLRLSEIVKAFNDPDRTDDRAIEQILSLVPKEHHELATQAVRSAQVAFWAMCSENYGEHTMKLLNRSKKEVGLVLERRGRRVFYSGRKADEAKVAELRREARF